MINGDESKVVPAKRQITVRDVFRHTTGYGYGGGPHAVLDQAYTKAGMKYRSPMGMFPPEMTIEQAADALASIPAHHQPGARFTYGFSTDLLGRLIEVWSGESLDAFLATKIFTPLEMSDTGFSLSKGNEDRFASCHTIRQGQLEVLDDSSSSPFRDGFQFVSGGGGLLSTIDDYAKFCEMLVGGGERNGERVLKPETLALMFEDQLDDVPGDFQFGLGFSITPRKLGDRTVKQYAWGGYASTDFHVIPELGLFQIFVRQHIPSKHQLAQHTFAMVYDDLGESNADSNEMHWPGWLGPGRDGKVLGVIPPDPWPKKLERGWDAVVGDGYATPLVQGNHIFVHARQGEQEVVLCLERASGKEVWRKSFAVPFKMGGGGEAHGKGPKSNPMLDDGRLFTLSIDGTLTAWNATTGDQLWVRDSTEFGTKTPYWGASTSPIAANGKVFVHLGNDESGRLIAFDAATGEEVWTHGNDGAAYASPLIATLAGEPQIVEWNHRAVVGVGIDSGTSLWEFPLPHVGTNQNMPTPCVHRGQILVGGENRGVFGLSPRKGPEGWDVTVDWHQREVALDMSSAVVTDDNLMFGFSHYDTGRLFCLDIQSGEVKWTGPPRTGQNVTFLTVPGYVIALVNNGELRVFKATEESYQPVANYRVAESPTWAAPVLLQTGLLIKSKQNLTYWKFPSVK